MRLFFLEADSPLTKTFSRDEDGELIKSSYPHVRDFNSHEEPVANLEEFYEAVCKHAAQNHCLLKGQLQHPLRNESRAGSTDALDATHWVCFDIDNLEGIDSPEDFVTRVLPAEFRNASYVLQHSASAGIADEEGVRAHVFFLLSEPAIPEAIKHWMMELNLNTQEIRRHTDLSSNSLTLKFPLDITVNQNDKLIYIAPPILADGLEDPLAGERIKLVQKGHERVAYNFDHDTPNAIRNRVDERVNELREERGLRKKTAKYKIIGGIEILTNPEVAYVSGEKVSGDFVRLNLNGGDSWGYYYNPANPRFLYNFKNEPVVILRDMLPDYWMTIQERMEGDATRERPVVFRHRPTDTYYNGVWDPVNQRMVDLAQCASKDRMRDFCMNFGWDLPAPIEEWTYEFRPNDPRIVDFDARFCNRWQPTDTWKMAEPVQDIPPMVDRVLWSVVGDDKESYDHFLNWIACVVKLRQKTGTAWLLQGVQGTGKGLLVNEVLAPIIGRDFVVNKQMRDLDDRFNAELEQALIYSVDEVRIGTMTNASSLVNQLKNMITEPVLNIRAMRANARQVPNFTNFIFSSNDYDAMAIDPTDRRFNVAPRQEKQLVVTDEDVQQLRNEVPAFAGFLKAYNADMERARKPLSNKAKADMRAASQDSVEQMCTAIREGDLGYFVAYAEEGPVDDQLIQYTAFKSVLREWLSNVNVEWWVKLTEIYTVYKYLNAPGKSPGLHKFNRMLAHKNLLTQNVVRIGDRTARGFVTTWKATPEEIERWNEILEVKPHGKKAAA